jgi:hypothetical protein
MVNYRNTYNAIYITLSLFTGMMHKKHFKLKKHVILGFFPGVWLASTASPARTPSIGGESLCPLIQHPCGCERGLHSFLIQGDECIKEP